MNSLVCTEKLYTATCCTSIYEKYLVYIYIQTCILPPLRTVQDACSVRVLVSFAVGAADRHLKIVCFCTRMWPDSCDSTTDQPEEEAYMRRSEAGLVIESMIRSPRQIHKKSSMHVAQSSVATLPLNRRLTGLTGTTASAC